MRRLHFISLLFAAAVVFAACDNTLGTEDENETVIEDEEYDFHQIVRTKSDAEMTKAVNTFCFNLYNAGYEALTNTLWSPFSISTAMSMTSIGANGPTLTEIINTLGFSQMTTDDINDYYGKVLKTLLEADPSVALSVANSAWIENSFKDYVKKSYTQQINTFYAAEINYTDFSKTENARKIINDWCNKKTAGEIEEIIHDGDITNATKLILLNTLLFDAKWSSANAFDEKDSFDDFFNSSPVTMMLGRFDLPYYEDSKLQAVSLPFGNGAFRLTLVLPDRKQSFSDFAKGFNQEQWAEIKGKMATKNISVAIPRFAINYDVDLKETMSKLGIRLAFDPEKADLSGITECEDDLYIGKVNHSTKLGVDEVGAKAAAATAVIQYELAPGPDFEYTSPYDFYANHSFMMVIEESSTGAILFIGSKVQ